MIEYSAYLTYVTPPLLGAFIGYLTNKIAIRMLFRPLKRWKIGPIRVPMTPGVIPSKRHHLAVNIGEMVGEQLLTSDEITNSLRKEEFQEHLLTLIDSKTTSFLKRDLGPLTSIIPSSYRTYFDIAIKTISYRIKDEIHQSFATEEFRGFVDEAVEGWLSSFLARETETILEKDRREELYSQIEINLKKTFSGPALEERTHDFVSKEIGKVLSVDKCLQDILPETLQLFLIDTIHDQTPHFLRKAAEMTKDQDLQERAIKGIRKAIEEFISSLGPMSSMVKSFLDLDMVEGKIRDYLHEKEAEITDLLTSEGMEERVAAVLTERAAAIMKKPLTELTENLESGSIEAFSLEFSRQLAGLLRDSGSARYLAAIISRNIENQLNSGDKKVGEVLEDLLGKQDLKQLKRQIKDEIVSASRSHGTQKMIDQMIDAMVEKLITRPIGRLDHIIPLGVRDGMCRSLQAAATNVMISEVPGVVKSIRIKTIVSDKIDSFDLLRLEKLLLTIMEEQFKYINLFGALLGFIIGCANLLLLIGLPQ